MNVSKVYDRKKAKAELRQWKRKFRREFLKGPVHEFRDGNPEVDGEILVMTASYRRRRVRVKPENIIRPFGPVGLKLADDSEMNLESLRDRVEGYNYSYNEGFDPLTGDDLREVKSFEYYTQKKDDDGNVISLKEKTQPKRLDEYKMSQDMQNEADEYGDKRNAVVPDREVYRLLMERIFDADFIEKCETAKCHLDK